MSRIWALLRRRGGVTLVEMMAATALLMLLIVMCAAALQPAAAVMRRMRRLSDAQVILDDILETIRAELEEARDHVKIQKGSAGRSDTIEFGSRNGFTLLISADGCGPTKILDQAGGQVGDLEEKDPGRLLYRYYHPKTGVQPDTARALTTVYPEEFYMGMYLGLDFEAAGDASYVTVTASLYRDEGRDDLVCSEALLIDLRYAGEKLAVTAAG